MVMINIRVSKEVKKHLKELAAQEGKTLSAMLREAATGEARKVLRKYKLRPLPDAGPGEGPASSNP